MYRLDWIEQLKLRAAAVPAARDVGKVDPVVWKLGVTSLLTDVSSEMVNSILPVYLVLHLHISPLQYGLIDGLYNGVAIALLSLAAGVLADRTRRHKEVAAVGYGLSVICKLLLLAVGTAWGWITVIVAIDRTGKGTRSAPRDALISLSSPGDRLASAFAVHRALDAGGSLLGPIVAFGPLAQLPGAFDVVWTTSFVFGLLGLAVLWLFVKNQPTTAPIALAPFWSGTTFRFMVDRRFCSLAAAGALLSAATVSDGFLYLLLQQQSGLATGFFPLFYVITACAYMALSIPVGRVADRWGRVPVLLCGYVAIALVYVILLSPVRADLAGPLLCLLLLGLYYAATEGVLMAMASAVIPVEGRTSGLATLMTCVSLAKMASSLIFGWLWQSWSAEIAVLVFALGLATALLVSRPLLLPPRNRSPDTAR